MHILREKYPEHPALKPLEEILDKMAQMKLTDTNLPWHDTMSEAAALLNSVSKELAE